MDTVLVFTFSTRYQCSDRINGIMRYAKGRRWHVQPVERKSIKGSVAQIIDFWKPIGIIAECGGGFPEITKTAIGDIPIVYLDENPGGHRGKAMYVNSDSSEIGRVAARELMSSGLRRFAFVHYPGAIFWSESRCRAFTEAVTLHGYDVPAFNHEAWYGDARRCKALSRFLRGLPKPCGVFAANDPAADEVLEVASGLGLSVPDDLSVIGVDDDETICERSVPPLTSIRVDFERGGYLAAELLGGLVDDRKTAPRTVTYSPICVVHRLSVSRAHGRAGSDARAIRGLEYIRREACSHIGVPDVVREMGCGRRQAEMLFRGSFGSTILEEITKVRMERARALLMSRGVSTEAVANRCGWYSVSAFRTAFRKAFGVSVSEWVGS